METHTASANVFRTKEITDRDRIPPHFGSNRKSSYADKTDAEAEFMCLWSPARDVAIDDVVRYTPGELTESDLEYLKVTNRSKWHQAMGARDAAHREVAAARAATATTSDPNDKSGQQAAEEYLKSFSDLVWGEKDADDAELKRKIEKFSEALQGLSFHPHMLLPFVMGLRAINLKNLARNERLDALESRVTEVEGRPVLKYRGTFEYGAWYKPGETVTAGGSLWYAHKKTNEVPGEESSRSWQCCVKRGRDGKDVPRPRRDEKEGL